MNPFDRIQEPTPRIGNRPHPIGQKDDLFMIAYKDLCFAVSCRQGVVIFAAPCARWMIGKDWSWCQEYWKQRGAEITFIPVKPDNP